ncbi:MAG: tRNA (adenosine(37)-N6)-threonylcarbamoyltransferase complex ATPase subunit type 1 TsaE [Parvularculaceae bacterium]
MIETTSDLAFEALSIAGVDRLGGALAARLRPGDVIALSGPLGAGKTTLARAVIAAAAGVAAAPSPTFAIAASYPTPDFDLWHFDVYRLAEPADVWEAGLEIALDGGVSIIEWAERIAPLLPSRTLIVRLDPVDGPNAASDAGLDKLAAERRRVVMRASDEWGPRLAGLNCAAINAAS